MDPLRLLLRKSKALISVSCRKYGGTVPTKLASLNPKNLKAFKVPNCHGKGC